MKNSRALKQLAAAVVAGACLFLDGCAVPATRTEMAMVPDQHVAGRRRGARGRTAADHAGGRRAGAGAGGERRAPASRRRSSTRPPRSSGSSRRA